jgi:hypothetical protein
MASSSLGCVGSAGVPAVPPAVTAALQSVLVAEDGPDGTSTLRDALALLDRRVLVLWMRCDMDTWSRYAASLPSWLRHACDGRTAAAAAAAAACLADACFPLPVVVDGASRLAVDDTVTASQLYISSPALHVVLTDALGGYVILG